MVNEQIKQIGQRLSGLRESIDVTVAEMATVCEVNEADYRAMECGERDIPVSVLHNVSQHYKVELSALMFGNEAYLNSYFLTRKGAGAKVERTKAYQYESLAGGFSNRKADPFMVTVEPREGDIYLNTHSGQEYNYVVEGRLELNVAGKSLILEAGDSIYFDSSRPHGMRALDGKSVKFLAIII